MGWLVKRQTVLDRTARCDTDTHAAYLQEEDGDLKEILYLEWENYLSMGSPEKMTVTIVPGDELNTVDTEDTMMKVAEAIRHTELKGGPGNTLDLTEVQDIIASMQNAGILFRERG